MITDPAKRFGAFFSRVETERSVLETVNQRFSEVVELHGLTLEAIQRWGDKVSKSTHQPTNLMQIVSILKRISARCESEADQSRIVFDDKEANRLPIHDLMLELALECSQSGV